MNKGLKHIAIILNNHEFSHKRNTDLMNKGLKHISSFWAISKTV